MTRECCLFGDALPDQCSWMGSAPAPPPRVRARVQSLQRKHSFLICHSTRPGNRNLKAYETGPGSQPPPRPANRSADNRAILICCLSCIISECALETRASHSFVSCRCLTSWHKVVTVNATRARVPRSLQLRSRIYPARMSHGPAQHPGTCAPCRHSLL